MDLSTNFMGLKLKNPIIPSASPLSYNIDSVKKLEDAGASAVILYSLFEEQIEHETGELDHYLMQGTESFAEALSYFPEISDFKTGPEEYLKYIQTLKKTIDIPVIASLNGVSEGGWMKYASLMEEAGADGIELNIYYIPTNINIDGNAIENLYIKNLKAVKSLVKIPVEMKLSPYFTSMSNIAKKLDEAGADGLLLFNRFYQPDFDLENLEVVPNLVLSSNWEMRLPLRWIAILFGKVQASLAATSGIQNHLDVLKVIMAGGDAAMIASELLIKGPERISEILKDMEKWMEEKEYDSISLMKGSMSQRSVAEPAAFERANYMKTLYSYNK
ncbi:MAG: dihydroorotate dehydrogenase-like protein [Ignavibacteria bacterium]|nr:dihydroorotate dehydrogenase-like protein [Ignavibacteria bacterium]